MRLNATSKGYTVSSGGGRMRTQMSKPGLPTLLCGIGPSMVLMTRRVQFTFVYVLALEFLQCNMYTSLNPHSCFQPYSLKR